MDRKEVLLVNKLTFEFILSLSELELEELLKKNMKLALVKCKDLLKEDSSKSEDDMIAASINKLYLISSKEEATKYLSEFRVVDLRKIAKKSNIFIKCKSKKIEIIDRIVEGTIGAKIKIDILKS